MIVDESIIYPLKPTASLSSISPKSMCTPLVLISNAATESPCVLAPGPPVPLTVISLNMAFNGRFEYWLWLYCSTITPLYMESSITTLSKVGLVVHPSVMCLTKTPLSDLFTLESSMRGTESSTQMPAEMAIVDPLIFDISKSDSRPPELPQ